MIRNAIVVGILLLIPLALTIRDGNIEGVGWNWKPDDFIFAFVFLFGAGLVYEFIATKMTKTSHRVVVGSVITLAALVIWVELATGGISRTVNLLLG